MNNHLLPEESEEFLGNSTRAIRLQFLTTFVIRPAEKHSIVPEEEVVYTRAGFCHSKSRQSTIFVCLLTQPRKHITTKNEQERRERVPLSYPLLCQLSWKNPDENPSGPGAFPRWIAKTPSRTSSSVGSVIRSLLMVIDTRFSTASSIT